MINALFVENVYRKVTGMRTKIVENEERSLEGESVSSLIIENVMGKINLTSWNSDKFEIKIKKEIEGYKESEKKAVLDNMYIETLIENDSLKIIAKAKDNKDKKLFEWKQENNYTKVEFSVNYEMKVPKGIKLCKIDNGTGDIKIVGCDASINISEGTGNIKISDSTLKGDNVINVGTGSIDTDLNLGDSNKLFFNSGTGDVSLTIPEGSKFSFEGATGVGNLSGNLIESTKGSLKKDINGGGISVKLFAGVGNIKLNEK